MSLLGAFAATSVAVVDYNDPREELDLDTPCKVTLHLKKPNIQVTTDAEEMLDPVRVKWRVKTKYGGRHQLHGPAFEAAATRGEGAKYWKRVLDEAFVATGGMLHGNDDAGNPVDVPVEEKELR